MQLLFLLGTGVNFPFWIWLRTSPFSNIPLGPVPVISFGDMPYFSKRFLTAGPRTLQKGVQWWIYWLAIFFSKWFVYKLCVYSYCLPDGGWWASEIMAVETELSSLLFEMDGVEKLEELWIFFQSSPCSAKTAINYPTGTSLESSPI